MKNWLTLFAVASLSVTSHASIPLDYYASMDGLKGEALKTATCKIIHGSLSYQYVVSTMYTNLRDNFKYTDYIYYDDADDPSVAYWWDRYSDVRNVIDYDDTYNFGTTCGYQREHSLPKSWWKDTSLGTSDNATLMYTKAYCDMHHLFPANGTANNYKSNWPLGVVETAAFDNGVTKVGTPKDGVIYGIDDASSITKVFEPADEFKGDFARAYMYVVTCYEELADHWNSSYLWMVQRNTYPVFTDWAKALILSWHRADPVCEKEFTRNEDVEKIQNNRNPFIDFPNLAEYIWGDSTTVTFNLATTVKALQESSDEVDAFTTLFEVDYTSTDGGNYQRTATDPGFDVWTRSSSYGWTATAYKNSKCNASDATLITPDFNLQQVRKAKVEFTHTANKFNGSSPSDLLSVIVYNRSTRKSTDISDRVTWPAGTNWTFVSSGEIDLSDFVGSSIDLEFRYTSTTSEAPTWEIKSIALSVVGTGTITGVQPNLIDSTQYDDRIVTYYSIDGRRVDPATYRGLVIRRTSTTAVPLLLR